MYEQELADATSCTEQQLVGRVVFKTKNDHECLTMACDFCDWQNKKRKEKK